MTSAIEPPAERAAAPAPRAPAAGVPAAFERLEYGKLCLSTAGRTGKGGEALPLTRSPDFPGELEDLCHPATIGFGDDLPAGCPEGWLLRAARGPAGLRPLACRLRRRPEDGEQGVQRSFWLGRFLCAAAPVDPWTCFQALRAAPLPALTVEDTRAAWPAIVVENRALPGADPRLRQFLPGAVVHTISAVPIGIAPAITPEQLFHWAAALWALLPATLQAAFAAGWGVASGQAPALNLSFTRGYPASVAVYDLRQERWHPPAERESDDGGRQPGPATPWRDSLLVPGRMYLREAFAWQEDGTPDLETGPRLAFLADLAPEAIAGQAGMGTAAKPGLLDLRSPSLAAGFVRTGIAALDHARLAVLARWLQAPGGPEPEGLCQAAPDYFTAGGKRQALALGLAAMAAGSPRGEAVLWQSLVRDPESLEFVDRTTAPPLAARLRLLHALAVRDAGGVLHALAAAPPGALDGPLAEEPGRRLADCLDSALAEGGLLLPRLAEVLRQPAIPATCRVWAESRAPEPAFALAALPGASPAALRALAGQTGDPCARWIADWREGARPRDGDLAAIAALAPERRSRLARQLLADWQDRSAGRLGERREAQLHWLEIAGGVDLSAAADPEWRVAWEGPELKLAPGERRTLVTAIEQGDVPASLRPRVAAVVLRRWHFYHQDCSSAVQGWADIIASWPAEVRLALGLDHGAPSPGAVDAEVSAAVKAFQLRSIDLEKILGQHQRAGAEVMQRIGPLLWEWCGRTDPEPDRPPLAPDICREMARTELPGGKASAESAELAALLARRTGFFTRHPGHLARLWELAAQAWQILLLLASAPAADLRPTLRQLEALVPHRRRLAQHLAMKGLEGRRPRHFAVATFDFHSQPFSGRPPSWQERYGGDSILWAAFSGVPFPKQGNLRPAIEAYAGSGPAHARDRLRLAQTYLDQFHRTEQRQQAVRRIARGVVAPLAQECGLAPAEVRQLLHDELAGSGLHRPPAWDDGGAEERAVVRAAKGFRMASWFRDFLRRIQDQGGGDVLLHEIG